MRAFRATLIMLEVQLLWYCEPENLQSYVQLLTYDIDGRRAHIAMRGCVENLEPAPLFTLSKSSISTLTGKYSITWAE